jgi:hypothetical protein
MQLRVLTTAVSKTRRKSRAEETVPVPWSPSAGLNGSVRNFWRLRPQCWMMVTEARLWKVELKTGASWHRWSNTNQRCHRFFTHSTFPTNLQLRYLPTLVRGGAGLRVGYGLQVESDRRRGRDGPETGLAPAGAKRFLGAGLSTSKALRRKLPFPASNSPRRHRSICSRMHHSDPWRLPSILLQSTFLTMAQQPGRAREPTSRQPDKKRKVEQQFRLVQGIRTGMRCLLDSELR